MEKTPACDVARRAGVILSARTPNRPIGRRSAIGQATDASSQAAGAAPATACRPTSSTPRRGESIEGRGSTTGAHHPSRSTTSDGDGNRRPGCQIPDVAAVSTPRASAAASTVCIAPVAPATSSATPTCHHDDVDYLHAGRNGPGPHASIREDDLTDVYRAARFKDPSRRASGGCC